MSARQWVSHPELVYKGKPVQTCYTDTVIAMQKRIDKSGYFRDDKKINELFKIVYNKNNVAAVSTL
jgi:hypothetical protein